jgi:hypothetical protein
MPDIFKRQQNGNLKLQFCIARATFGQIGVKINEFDVDEENSDDDDNGSKLANPASQDIPTASCRLVYDLDHDLNQV